MIDIGYTTTAFEDTIEDSVQTIEEANTAIFALKNSLSSRDDIHQLFMQHRYENQDGEVITEKFAWLDPTE